MELSGVQLIAIFIVSAIAGMGSVLDEFQTHRPLIACTLVGAILGDMTTGIIIGGTLEMIALGWMNIGAAMAPDAIGLFFFTGCLRSAGASMMSFMI